ncbi:MAG TPA: nickel pincer cofactor biosynthesis protein LarB [Candidatus Ornithomonoglobus intestinigallinarum]|uniref:Nickel pincer cofactor biosynthesis protein LarB n=1 Tax=Candidatus Ornithomonoglobus intestinigallinarum TaxID=2840894 RepID=A0A9D1H2I3_9FIRM|nr:nickel pincer cofactor biosynthesis protein LarB [Candidatus Ornithomonoglobus intestinigallinarum]
MEQNEVRAVLERVAGGELSVDEAFVKIKEAPFTELGYAKPDCQRGVRLGVPEVIYGEGKTAEQIAGISASLLECGQKTVLITRLSKEKASQAEKLLPKGSALDYRPEGRIGIIGEPTHERIGKIVIAAGGTSDIPVAEEAAITAEVLGNNVVRLYDVGVAGLHRLLSHADDIMSAKAIIAIAGMEGALASVIGGLADCPVIAVPTSIGYGASFNGLAALLSMLNSCASGVSVVNIDNGFGASYQASMINRRSK